MANLAAQIVAARIQTAFAPAQARLNEIGRDTGITFSGYLLRSSLAQDALEVDSSNSFSTLLSADGSNEESIKLITDMIQKAADEKATAASGNTATPGVTDAMSLLPASQYDELIRSASEEYGVSAALVKALIYAESGFRSSATSGVGAMGLMQLMPFTAEALAVNDPYDPAQNIDGGVRLLCSLLDRYNGDAAMAVAAYNMGAGGLDATGLTGIGGEEDLTALPEETQGLLNRILGYLGVSAVQELSVVA